MSHLMTKPTKWPVRPAKTQISLGIRLVWSEPSLCPQWVVKDPSFLHANSEDSEQTRQMPGWSELIRLGRCPGWSESSLGAHAILLVLSWGGSYFNFVYQQTDRQTGRQASRYTDRQTDRKRDKRHTDNWIRCKRFKPHKMFSCF